MKKKLLLFYFFLIFSSLTYTVHSQSRPVATHIKAQLSENQKIIIQWAFPHHTEPKITAVNLYRDTKPVSSWKQLSELKPIATLSPETTVFTDTPETAKEYYYAVTGKTENEEYSILIPALNYTIDGVQVRPTEINIKQKKIESEQSKRMHAKDEIREIPLPNLDFLSSEKETPLKFSDKAIKTAEEISRKYTANDVKQIRELYFFEEDMISQPSGDEYTLFTTLRATLVQRKYQDAINELKGFLSIRRNENVTYRANFYLGEAYYAVQDYQNALYCFLAAQEKYPELSKKWIESSLDLMQLDL